jgi:hypothetical protein
LSRVASVVFPRVDCAWVGLSFDSTNEPWGPFSKIGFNPWESSTHSVQVSNDHLSRCILVVYPLAIEHSYEMLCKMNENGELNSEIYLWNQVIFNSSVSLPGGKSIYHPIISHQISLFTSIKSAYCWYLPKFPPKMDGSPPSLHDFRATFRAGSR